MSEQKGTLEGALDRLRRQHDLGMQSLDALSRLLAGAITPDAYRQTHEAITAELESIAK